MNSRIKLVVFDWAGTVIDHGCFAPVVAFTKLFAAHGVEASLEQARAPMGLEKRDHIRTMLNDPDLAPKWCAAQGRDWTEDDVNALYNEFVPIQLEAIETNSNVIPGACEALEFLRKLGIKTAGTTGYFKAAAQRVEELARGQGFKLDANASAETGQAGRPAPWMIYKNMETLGIYPPSSVLKIGDTVHDIAEGLNAGAVSVAVLRGSSEVGLSADEFDALSAAERIRRLDAAKRKMLAAGAVKTIDSLWDLPLLLRELENQS